MSIKKSELLTSTFQECLGMYTQILEIVNLSSNKAYCVIKHRNGNVTSNQIFLNPGYWED